MVYNARTLGCCPMELTNTSIYLIPKDKHTVSMAQLRPISLDNVSYNYVPKSLIVQRIRPIMNSIIYPMQGALIPERPAAEHIILTKEVVHSIRRTKKKSGYTAIKNNLAKAYNRVDWRFLQQMLEDFSFPSLICLSLCLVFVVHDFQICGMVIDSQLLRLNVVFVRGIHFLLTCLCFAWRS